MSNKQIQKLSEANFEIMRQVWKYGEITINQVLDAVNSGRKKKLKRATIQVQMNRLVKYGWLKYRKVNREFYYSALRGQEEATHDILKDVKDRIFGGSKAELVRCLFENSKVSPEELRKIIETLKKYERK